MSFDSLSTLKEIRKTFTSLNGRRQLCNTAVEYRDLIIDSKMFTITDILKIVRMFGISNVGWEPNALDMFLQGDILTIHGLDSTYVFEVARVLQFFIDKSLSRHLRVLLDKVYHLFIGSDGIRFELPEYSNSIRNHFLRHGLGGLLYNRE